MAWSVLLLAAAAIGLLVLGGLAVLAMLLVSEKTRLVTIVLLALSVPGALVVGGGLFLLLWADTVTYELQPPLAPSVEFDPKVIYEVPPRVAAEENAEAEPPEPADTAAEAAPAAEPETNADASNATSEDPSDGGNS